VAPVVRNGAPLDRVADGVDRLAGARRQELVAKLLAWRHPGFSAHVGDPIAPEEK
jgi:hypothetical protein